MDGEEGTKAVEEEIQTKLQMRDAEIGEKRACTAEIKRKNWQQWIRLSHTSRKWGINK